MKDHFSNIGKDKEYDAIMIESKEEKITLESPVAISLYDTKTGQWLIGLTVITSMEDALQNFRKKVSKDKNVQDYLEQHYKKDEYITEQTFNPQEGYVTTKNVAEETKMKKEQTTEKKKPEQKFRAGSVTATVWGKEIDVERNGKKEKATVYNVEIVKNYKDGEDWKKTSSYNRDDLVKLQVVLAKATEFLFLNEEQTE